ncbi:MAG: hypothetical protein ABJB61_11350 [bacterium]
MATIARGSENTSMFTGHTSPAFRRLINFLIVKSMLDVLFVGVVAVGFYYRAFDPYFQGTLDEAGPEQVAGWVVNQRAPDAPVEVQLYIDGRFADSRAADYPRPDIVAAGAAADARHGFFFYTPPLEAGEHEARVYVVHASFGGRLRTLQLLGTPARFRSEALPADPFYRGWLEDANQQIVRGWVVNRDVPAERVEVHLYIDGRFIEQRAADYPRPELYAGKLLSDERHGFLFFTSQLSEGGHEARVYAARTHDGGRQLLLVGRPLRFHVKLDPPATGR